MNNTITIGNEYFVKVKVPDSGEHAIKFRLHVRDGVTEKRLNDTVYGFVHVLNRLANGDLEVGEHFQKHEVTDLPEHGEPGVAIYTLDKVPVFNGEGLDYLSINVYHENTNPQRFMEACWWYLKRVNVLCEKGVIDKSWSKRASKPAPAPQPAQAAERQDVQPTAPTQVMTFNYLSADERAELEADDSVKKVHLLVGAVEHRKVEFDNGNSVNQIFFWPNDGEYAHSYKFAVTVDERDNNYSLKAVKKAGLLSKVPEAGYKVPVHGVATYKKSKGKGQHEGKVWWNFEKFTASDVALDPPPAQGGDAMDEFMGQDIPASDIPF